MRSRPEPLETSAALVVKPLEEVVTGTAIPHIAPSGRRSPARPVTAAKIVSLCQEAEIVTNEPAAPERLS